MDLQDINVGTAANDGTGDNPRAAALKINANNAMIAEALGDDPDFAATMATALAGKQAASSNLNAIAGAAPIADGAHTVGGITITTVGGIIVAIS